MVMAISDLPPTPVPGSRDQDREASGRTRLPNPRPSCRTFAQVAEPWAEFPNLGPSCRVSEPGQVAELGTTSCRAKQTPSCRANHPQVAKQTVPKFPNRGPSSRAEGQVAGEEVVGNLTRQLAKSSSRKPDLVCSLSFAPPCASCSWEVQGRTNFPSNFEQHVH